jgi:hypothetical protein
MDRILTARKVDRKIRAKTSDEFYKNKASSMHQLQEFSHGQNDQGHLWVGFKNP